MIAKKIPNPAKSAKKVVRITELLNYITAPERENGVEKCIASGAANFLTRTHNGHKVEMIALAEEAVKSKDPVDHWVLSWAPGETPTADQVEEAVEIFIAHCGLNGHQYVWGYHDDTEIRHAHIAVNRVHPDTHKVTEINKGFDREASQQAIALIEHKQGWRKAEHARYTIENGQLVLTAKGAHAKGNRDKPRKPSNRAQSMEIRTGEKSVERRCIEEAAPIIAKATSWHELHEGLVAIGMEYRKEGSGARIYLGDISIKASDADRKASISALQKRFGHFQSHAELIHEYQRHTIDNPYEPHFAKAGRIAGQPLRMLSSCRLAHSEKTGRGETHLEGVLSIDAGSGRQSDRGMRWGGRGVGARGIEPRPIKPDQHAWEEYAAARAVQRAEKERATIALQNRHQEESARLLAKLKLERTAALAGNWRGKGAARNAMASVIATQQDAEKLALRERQAVERKVVHDRFAPMPPYREWQLAPAIVSKIAIDDEAEIHIRIAADKASRLSTVLRQLEHEQDWRGRMVYRSKGVEIFRDEGRRLAILNPRSDEAIAVALAVAQQKFGSTLTLTGDQAFQQRVVAVAVAQGMNVKFADPALEALRLETKAAGIRKHSEKALPAREKWHEARRAIVAKQPATRAVAPAPPRSVAPKKALEDEPKADGIAVWLAAHPERQVRELAPLPAAGRVLEVVEDGRMLLNLNRAGDVAIYPARSNFRPEVGELIELDKRGQVVRSGLDIDNGKTK